MKYALACLLTTLSIVAAWQLPCAGADLDPASVPYKTLKVVYRHESHGFGNFPPQDQVLTIDAVNLRRKDQLLEMQKEVAWTIIREGQVYVKVFGRVTVREQTAADPVTADFFLASEHELIGKEEVQGRMCEVYRNKKSEHNKYWLWNGLVLKDEYRNGQYLSIHEAIRIEENNPLPEDTFAVPPPRSVAPAGGYDRDHEIEEKLYRLKVHERGSASAPAATYSNTDEILALTGDVDAIKRLREVVRDDPNLSEEERNIKLGMYNAMQINSETRNPAWTEEERDAWLAQQNATPEHSDISDVKVMSPSLEYLDELNKEEGPPAWREPQIPSPQESLFKIARDLALTNDLEAKSILRSLSQAAEEYFRLNKIYPVSIHELMDADPPFLQTDYCDPAPRSGFTFRCEFSPTGYTFTSTPQTAGKTGSGTFRISTGGKLEAL